MHLYSTAVYFSEVQHLAVQLFALVLVSLLQPCMLTSECHSELDECNYGQ